MGKLLSSPKLLLIGIAVLALIGAGLAGGALGAAFGGGFFGAPIAHIQLAAEPITASPQISDIPVLGDFRVTNTMVATWAAILVLAVVSWLGHSTPQRGAGSAAGGHGSRHGGLPERVRDGRGA